MERVTGTYAAPKRTWYISTVNLFAGLPERDVREWVNRCGTRTFDSGERIVDANTTPPEQVLVVRRGAVRLLLEPPDGRAETIDLLGAGQLFGVSAAFGSSSIRLHADALTRVEVCVADGRSFPVVLASSPDMVLNLVRQAGTRLIQFGAEYFETQQPAEVRLADVLRRLALTAGEAVPGGLSIPPCVSRGTLARQVGCTRETIARMLASLEMEGSVVRQRRSIVVDINRLEDIVRQAAVLRS